MITVVQPRSREEIEEEVQAIKKHGQKIRTSKQSARAFLIRAGFMTKEGKLAERYR